MFILIDMARVVCRHSEWGIEAMGRTASGKPVAPAVLLASIRARMAVVQVAPPRMPAEAFLDGTAVQMSLPQLRGGLPWGR
jgi:hypothetical protein